MEKRKPRRRRSRSDGSPYRWAAEVFDRLERIHRELCQRRSAEVAPLPFDVHVETLLNDGNRTEASRAFASALITAMNDRVTQSLAIAGPLVPGRVYCFWCDSAICHHAVPPAPRTVFSGYGPSGLPRWEDLATVCLSRQDARVDLLHRSPPQPFTLSMDERALRRDQLAEFGATSRLFRILHQAVVGYLPFSDQEVLGNVALTLQIVEYQAVGHRPRLALNIVGKTVTGEDFAAAADGLADRRPADVFETARRRLADLASHRPGAERDREFETLLKHCASSLERICRQESRRTKHARMRHRDPTRPAGAALKDVERAGPDQYFLDNRRGTYVVLGPRCRAHFFNKEGRHVTSLVCRGEEIEHRMQTNQWKVLEPTKSSELKARILAAGEPASESSERPQDRQNKLG